MKMAGALIDTATTDLRAGARRGPCALIVAGVLLLSACGQTGPLFLPRPGDPPKQPPADNATDQNRK